MKESIAGIRKNYSRKKLLEKKAAADPITQFAKWWKQALKAGIEEVNAMTLATASADGMPAARIVLLKDFDQRGFTFFSDCLIKNWKKCQFLQPKLANLMIGELRICLIR